jgi:Ca-activated chloride channel family protein
MVGVMVLAFSAPSRAEEGESKTLSPYFFIEGGDPGIDNFPLKETDVKVAINGVIADVTVIQKYANEGDRPIHGRYIFPASTRAAVHGMKMTIGNQVVIAKIKEKEEAKKEFEAAKSAGKSASLLEQQRPNVFSMNVANIMPKDVIEIELRYTELLVPTAGIYEFVYPTVVGPRYSNQPAEGAPETDKWIQNPYLKEGTLPKTMFRISATLSAGLPLQEVVCPSHQAGIRYENQSMAQVELPESEKYSGNKDFILNYRLAGKAIQSGLMLYEGKDENFFLLMVQPPQRAAANDIVPREYIFVVDVSGSMHGFPLNVSKELLKNLISSLKPIDKFNVVLFAGTSAQMAPESVPVTVENIQKAWAAIDSQQGSGGTELLSAVKRAMAIPKEKGFSRTILLLSDGYIDGEKGVFDYIHENLDQANVFSFGIGTSVNRYLIEGVAKAGMGEPFVVTKPDEASRAAQRFCDYVKSPVLTGIKMHYSGFEVYDLEPAQVPDVFAERPVVVTGKWRGKAAGLIELIGIAGSGSYKQTFNVAETKPVDANQALRYLWARTRIARLSDYGLGKGDPENKAEVISLGLTYNLLTAYTSFIAVHEVIRNVTGQGQDVNQPLPLPEGVSDLAVGDSSASVPEPEMILLLALLGFIFLTHWLEKSRWFKMESKRSLSKNTKIAHID